MFQSFLIALQLMTRIPVPVKLTGADATEKAVANSVLFYPVIGLLIGVVLVVLHELLILLYLPIPGFIEAGLLLLVWVLITGALHLDGLADSADAWLGGFGDKKRTLEIMKDPYCGPAGVVSLVILLLLKFSALTVVNWQVLIVAPVLARTAVVVLFASTPYVRKGGMGESVAKSLTTNKAIINFLLVILFTFFILGQQSVFLLFVFAIAYMMRKIMLKRIGGTTGDTAGAMIEVLEASTLIIFILADYLE